jgi:betaine-aldehyde dehydrogenase
VIPVSSIKTQSDTRPEQRRELAQLRSEYAMFIAGKWVTADDGATMESIDPSTEDTLATFPAAGARDVDQAVIGGIEAQKEWYARGWQHRATVLNKIADRLAGDADRFAMIDAIDGGIPVNGMIKDVNNSVAYLRYFAGIASELKGQSIESPGDSINIVLREPYGVVGRIVPFNHPLQFAAAALASPLAAGNAVILKPSDHTPLSTLHLAELLEDLVPPGLVSIITGDYRAGSALVEHPKVPRVGFTGSVASGRAVLRGAAEHIKHVSLELGGKNPMIVFPDSDLDRVTGAAVDCMNLRRGQGQSCGSPSRIFVHRDIYDEFVGALRALLAGFSVGDPADPAVDMGPLAYRAHYERVCGYVTAGLEDGAHLAVGGNRPPGLDRGFYLEPTIFTDVTTSMRIAQEEIFGPVISILKWDDEDEVLAWANELPLGLTANIWTRDINRALRFAKSTQAGYVWVNGTGARPWGAPFGGHKLSGLGSENDLGELLSYTQVRNISFGAQ